MTKRRGIVLVDLDATLAAYDGTFVEGQVGPPLDGAREAIDKLREKHYVVCWTSRTDVDVWTWARKHGFTFDDWRQKPTFAGERVLFTIDDRAIRFDGSWKRASLEAERFAAGSLPWWKGPS